MVLYQIQPASRAMHTATMAPHHINYMIKNRPPPGPLESNRSIGSHADALGAPSEVNL